MIIQFILTLKLYGSNELIRFNAVIYYENPG